MVEPAFDDLLNRLLDDELDPQQRAELVRMVKTNPHRQDELQSQLETAELIVQAEDDLRAGPLFLSALRSRIDEENAPHDPFVRRVRTAVRSSSPRTRITRWGTAALLVAAVVVLGMAYSVTAWRESRAEQPITRITALAGSLQWLGDGGRVVSNLEVGSWLGGGTLESRAADSWAELQFRDGSTITVSGRATLTISEGPQKRLYLGEGRLSASVAPQPPGRPMQVLTPTSRLEILGTQFNVDAELSSTVVMVNEGRVRVTRLADGRIVEVPAGHRVVAGASRDAELTVTSPPRSVDVWQSTLPNGIVYGTWNPETRSLRATPLLWHDCKKKQQPPLLLYVAALSVSRGESPLVELQPGATFRIRGRWQSPHDLVIGMTTQHLKGGFAGKYHVYRKAASFSKPGGEFTLDVPIEAFVPEEPNQRKSPAGLVLYDWWCLTINNDAGLSIVSVELVSRGEN